MLFHVTFLRRDTAGEEADRRILAILEKFEPAPGLNIQTSVTRADGMGGYAIVEADDTMALAAGPPLFAPYYSFEYTPVVQQADGTTALAAAVAFRESLA